MMLSKLLRPLNRRQNGNELNEQRGDRQRARQDYREIRHASADFTEADEDEDEDEDQDARDYDDENSESHDERDREHRGRLDDDENYGHDSHEDNEDGPQRSRAILPLFSARHLDSLPIYSITHAIRIIVQTRTETTLTWEQLRSPQVSQFLVKPMQQQIRTQHFSRATLYALMANCLQFAKEGQLYPGNAGTSSTRAKICELLAIKLLKEYTTRELIDALSYDFYPLQGLPEPQTPHGPGRPKPAAVRTSALEVAIRASAKSFLAHPLVVQQLEAIWNGAISFYSSADQLHRVPLSSTVVGGGLEGGRLSNERAPLLGNQQGKEDHIRFQIPYAAGRRTVMLYNPRSASLFKLSRLRVPKYRHLLSTCSLAVLICLFLTVLIQRSNKITTLELLFWFWSAGFMLDELVGFTEQGFSLYIMSFWNIFDLGILLLLVFYYCLRIWGVFVLEPQKLNDMAYDVLAANAIVLLPRVFSVLDHYPYFSQLLLGFRIMALDLVCVFILILISCSGFFVYFTLSKNHTNAGDAAFRIFQLLMGFTPAAWDTWRDDNWLGRAVMALFLIICHFVIVTILITVLTNSFLSVSSNAKQEHQYLFAINTISMVKQETLFSYVAPGNIFAWLLMPLRYCVPMRQFVWLNRFVIKITHLPLLFVIYLYERFFLAPSIYEPTDLVENMGRGRRRQISLADPSGRSTLFSPNVRVREESVVGYQKDRALEEVFRRGPNVATLRTKRRHERHRTQSAIRNWIDQNEGTYNSPANYSTIESRPGGEWSGRLQVNLSRDQLRRQRQYSEVRSAASDPADVSNVSFWGGHEPAGGGIPLRGSNVPVKEMHEHTDAEGDDELVTNDEDEDATNTLASRSNRENAVDEDYFTTPVSARFNNKERTSTGSLTQQMHKSLCDSRRQAMHSRTLSTNTILYAPAGMRRPPSESSPSAGPSSNSRSRPLSNRQTPAAMPTNAGPSGIRSPRRPQYVVPRVRPNAAGVRGNARNSSTNRGAAQSLDIPTRKGAPRRQTSVDLDASSELNAAMAADDACGAVASSFATQMAMMTPISAKPKASSDNSRMNRLMLAKMKTLEEGLGDVVREMRVLRSAVPSTAHNSGDEGLVKGKQLGRGFGTTSTGPTGLPVSEVVARQTGGYKRAQAETSQSLTQSSHGKRISRPASLRSLEEPRAGMDSSRRGGRDVVEARYSAGAMMRGGRGKGKADFARATLVEHAYDGEDSCEDAGGQSSADDFARVALRRRGSSF